MGRVSKLVADVKYNIATQPQGWTVNLNDDKASQRYVVGAKEVDDIDDIDKVVIDGIAQGYDTVGGWYDADNDKIVIDYGYRYNNRASAILAGYTFHQTAIWDDVEGKEIFMNKDVQCITKYEAEKLWDESNGDVSLLATKEGSAEVDLDEYPMVYKVTSKDDLKSFTKLYFKFNG